MQKFTILARSGLYMTLIAIIGQAVVSVTSMPYHTATLIAKGLMLCLIAGFALSLLAIVIGRSANVRFDKARRSYTVAGLSLIASGAVLAFTWFTFLRGILGRFRIFH